MNAAVIAAAAQKGGEKASPYIEAAKVGVDLITFFMNRADQNKAQKEAKSIDTRNFAYGQQRDAFAEKIQNQTMALNKQGQAFGQQQTIAQNVEGINSGMIKQMTDAINNNESLKNLVIGRWGA